MNSRPLTFAAVAVLLFGCSQVAPTAPGPSPSTTSAGSVTSAGPEKSAADSASSPAEPARDPFAVGPTKSANGGDKSSDGDRAKSPADDLVAQARQAAEAADFTKAVELLDNALAEEPANLQALAFMTETAQMKGQEILRAGDDKACLPFFMKSATAFRKCRETQPALPQRMRQLAPLVLYNEACCHAIDGKPDEAVKSLDEAIDAGFNDASQFDKDKDLDSLRERDDYKKVRARLGAK